MQQEKPLKVRMDRPAPFGNEVCPGPRPDETEEDGWERWSFPIGNGYLGACVFGRTQTERIQLTENSLSNSYPEGLTNLCELYLDLGHAQVKDYERTLDLRRAVVDVAYHCGGVRYHRSVFASYPDRVIAVRLAADRPGSITFGVRAEIPFCKEGEKGKTGTVSCAGDTLRFDGRMAYYGQEFAGRVRVLHQGGSLCAQEKGLRLEGADSALILVCAATNYVLSPRVFLEPDRHQKLAGAPAPGPIADGILQAASTYGYEELLARHLADYTALFSRCEVDLGGTEGWDLPCNQLLEEYKNGNRRAYLEELYFQFGRYLLIASSRKGALPPNLQGVWNRYDTPPWSAGYWHNINQEMNYWHAFSTNLAELFDCYLDFFEAYRPAAQQKADQYIQQYYPGNAGPDGENGWALGSGSWPLEVGGPRLDLHSGPGTGGLMAKVFWDAYDFTRDKSLLRRRIYPALRGMSQFLSKVVEPDGAYLLTTYSASPEQKNPDGSYHRTKGCAFDQQMVWETHRDTLRAAEILGEEDAFTELLRKQMPRLDPVQIGADGQIKEFREETHYGEIGEKNHRHISHLVGLYPGTRINRSTPEWLRAAEHTLNLRGDYSRGWAVAHRLCAWARTGNGARAYDLLRMLLETCTLPNLWDVHPPFQLDGNCGGAAGIAELLLQSHEDVIRPLPALPPAWKQGSFRGLVARGGFVVDAAWQDGKLTSLRLTARVDGPCRIAYPSIGLCPPQGAQAEGPDEVCAQLCAGQTLHWQA